MDSIVDDVNRTFKDILFELDSPPGPALEEKRRFEEGLRSERCLMGDGVLPSSLKPCFVTRRRMERAGRVVEALTDALEKVVNLYFEDPSFRDRFELGPGEEELVALDPGFPGRAMVFARADGFLAGEEMHFVAFHCDSPGGAYYTDVQTGLLAETEPVRQLQARFSLDHEPLVPRVLETLLDRYEAWGGARANPAIAVVGDGAAPNASEFALFGEYFGRQGLSGFFCQPWELAYDGNVLSHRDRPVNILYRRGAIADIARNPEGARPLVEAARDGNVCMVNPFRSKLGDNKNLLGLLTDERVAPLLSEEQKGLVARHVPWTRVLAEGSTEYQGLQVDLLEFVAGNREKFVIKPNGPLGRRDVLIGREADTRDWYDALEGWRKQQLVVQEYVPVPREDFPAFEPDLGFAEKNVGHSFFVFDGRCAGGFARISARSVIDVADGGELAPLMVVDEE